MAFRLVVQLRNRTVRVALPVGTHVVGSSPDCAVKISHVTVSRKHARLEVADSGVTVTDLGSTNGTMVDGWAASGATAINCQTVLRFGNVKAQLEEAGAEDFEAGVVMTPPAVEMDREVAQNHEALSTVGPAALEVFSLQQLPKLAESVARGESRADVAQAVGAALLRSLPSHRVEIVHRAATGEEGVLFSGQRGQGGEATVVAETAGHGYVLRVGFVNSMLAETYGPLVRAAASLVRAAGRRTPDRGSAPPAPPSQAEPPRPPSVVNRFRDIYRQAERIAVGRVSVLIRGESGTGKELLARFIHAASDRAAEALETLNCAALPRDLLEAELFGVEKGVATGVDARPGRFETAHGGTLFLDEIGDMALETQARILRVLQEGEVYRVGGREARPAEVRVLSATNRDIDGMLADGRFRSDLYHRIADWVVVLPPLRERRADIANLAAHFLSRACLERGVQPAGISRAAVGALEAFSWPGNVRQLEREMCRAALFVEDGELLDTSRLQPSIVGNVDEPAGDSLKEVLERAERLHIQSVLEGASGVVADAAERLGVGLSTLYRRMKALGID